MQLPPGLLLIRQQIFKLDALVTWTADEFAQYWPYVDNIWVHNCTRPTTKNETQKSYWWCQLWKDDAEKKTKSQGTWAKRMRISSPCSRKLLMIKQFNEDGNLFTVTLNSHLDKKSTMSDEDSHQHSHTLEYLDNIKVNSAFKLTAGREVAKGYAPAIVNRNMQGIKWERNLNALKNAGGSHFNSETVYNAGRSFEKLNPNTQTLGAKKTWKDQMDECFDALQALGEDVLSAKLNATRIIDKELSHAVAFARQSRLRILMK